MYPLIPLIFIISCGWMLYQATEYANWSCALAVLLVILGVPLYWLSCLITPTPTKKGPIDLGLPPRQPPPPPVGPSPVEKGWR
jgi:hypothetical protein